MRLLAQWLVVTWGLMGPHRFVTSMIPLITAHSALRTIRSVISKGSFAPKASLSLVIPLIRLPFRHYVLQGRDQLFTHRPISQRRGSFQSPLSVLDEPKGESTRHSWIERISFVIRERREFLVDERKGSSSKRHEKEKRLKTPTSTRRHMLLTPHMTYAPTVSLCVGTPSSTDPQGVSHSAHPTLSSTFSLNSQILHI